MFGASARFFREKGFLVSYYYIYIYIIIIFI